MYFISLSPSSLLSSPLPLPSLSLLPSSLPLPPFKHHILFSYKGEVTHYRIKQDELQKYFVSEKHRFLTIKELIEYHKLNGGGLVTRLRRPPAQLVPNIPLFGECPCIILYYNHVAVA